MRRLVGLGLAAALLATTGAEPASVAEVMPDTRDKVHAIWMNGPTHPGKLGGRWPSFGATNLGAPLVLLGSNGFCVQQSGSDLVLAQCNWYADAVQLMVDGEGTRLVTETGTALCAPADGAAGDDVALSSQCVADGFTVLGNNAVQHSSGLCLAPEDAASAFGSSATTPLVLSADCDSWSFEFWDDPVAPPPYQDGFTVGGGTGQDSQSPPRWFFSISGGETFRASFSDADGRVYGLDVVRVSDGVKFEHTLSEIVHTTWQNGRMYLRPWGASDYPDGNYPDWLSAWNTFASPGTKIQFVRAEGGSGQCDTATNEEFTGYGSGGGYCQLADSAFATDPAHLLMHTGRLAVVVDAEHTGGNLMPLVGTVASADTSASDVYESLSAAVLTGSIAVTNTASGASDTLALFTDLPYTQIGLVRHGHTVAHILATGLGWDGTGSEFAELNDAHWWMEVSMWGDSVSVQLVWDAAASGCTATIDLALTVDGVEISSASADLSALSANLLLSVTDVDGIAPAADLWSSTVDVTSTTGSVVARSITGDVFIEVPTNTPKCGYATGCAPNPQIDATLTNSGDTESAVRLSWSRNFPTWDDAVAQSGTGAEITGLSAVLLDADGEPTGIPTQISKNWHVGSDAADWAGYDGYWWTFNALLRIPAGKTITLTLSISYQRYADVPAFSHAQLSIVGYSDAWLWEEAALNSGGENICLDPLGIHTRSAITDVRPNLFDGEWKENVGGGDLFVMFDAAGKFIYQKAIDAEIGANGPCLSNATYSSLSSDESIRSKITMTGGRTDDLVRVHFHVQHTVLKATNFSRLAFFQYGADTYNYNNEYEATTIGGGPDGDVLSVTSRTCLSGGSTDATYNQGMFRTALDSVAPWYIANGANTDPTSLDTTTFVVGDRGLVIRTYDAVLGGEDVQQPSVSVLCDKIELTPPRGLSTLEPGDFVDMRLEFLVLPREGPEFDEALAQTNSATLQMFTDSPTVDIVKAQAVGHIHVTALSDARVEAHYPIRVCAEGGRDEVSFRVDGSALGYVPIVICGLPNHSVDPDGTGLFGLWIQKTGDGELDYELLDQGASGDTFWQVNYDRASGTYETVYNVELFSSVTTIKFGLAPELETASPTVVPVPAPSAVPAPAPTPSPESPSAPSPTSLAPVYMVSSTVVLTGVTPDAFNADPAAISAFKDAIAAGLGIQPSDVFGVVAVESARRRRLDEGSGADVDFSVRLQLDDLEASSEEELLSEFQAVMTEATQPAGDFSTAFAAEAAGIPSLAEVEVDSDATAAAVEETTVARIGGLPTSAPTVLDDGGGAKFRFNPMPLYVVGGSLVGGLIAGGLVVGFQRNREKTGVQDTGRFENNLEFV